MRSYRGVFPRADESIVCAEDKMAAIVPIDYFIPRDIGNLFSATLRTSSGKSEQVLKARVLATAATGMIGSRAMRTGGGKTSPNKGTCANLVVLCELYSRFHEAKRLVGS